MGDVYIPNDWDGESYCCYSVMWPDSFLWRAVLNGLIDLGGTGFYYDEKSGSVIAARDAIQATWSYNFTNEVVFMTCNDATNELFQQLIDAVKGVGAMSGCCGDIPGATGGSGGAGMTPGEPSGVETGDDVRDGPPPPGYASWDEYDDKKCNMAKYIMDQLISDVAQFSLITIGAQTAVELAIAMVPLLLTPIGWAEVLAIALILIQMELEAFALSLVITHLETNEDEYICSLLAGSNVSGSISSFGAKVDELIDADGTFSDPISNYLAKNFIKSFATVDSFNRLYEPPTLNVPEYDCTCGLDVFPELFIPGGQTGLWGTMTWDEEAKTISGASTFGDGGYRANIHIIDDLSVGRCFQMDAISTTGSSHTVNEDFFYSCGSSSASAAPGGDANNLPTPECYHGILFASDTPFTYSISYIGVCEA